MPYQDDKFGHKAYDYKPAWEKDIDYSPDHRPSDAGMVIEDRGDDVLWALPVRGLGVILMRASMVDGKPVFNGLSTFTDDEIKFNDGLHRSFQARTLD